MAEYKVIISLNTDTLVDFSEEFMITLREIGFTKTIRISAGIPIAKLVVSRKLSNNVQNKITNYLIRKFNDVKIKGMKITKIKLKLKEEEKDNKSKEK